MSNADFLTDIACAASYVARSEYEGMVAAERDTDDYRGSWTFSRIPRETGEVAAYCQRCDRAPASHLAELHYHGDVIVSDEVCTKCRGELGSRAA